MCAMDAAIAQIRDAEAADAARCAAIYAPYVVDTVISFETVPPSPTEMWGRMSAALGTHAWLVAEREGYVVGYAYGHPFAPRAAYRWACETSIYLDRDQRGAGVGRVLYGALLERLAGRGYRTALGGMTLPNEASARLHRALGYAPAGVYRRVGWKNGAWHDVAWYQRDIGPTGEPPNEPR
jgi:L-amino acid N-acyltransferase YncA